MVLKAVPIMQRDCIMLRLLAYLILRYGSGLSQEDWLSFLRSLQASMAFMIPVFYLNDLKGTLLLELGSLIYLETRQWGVIGLGSLSPSFPIFE